MSASATFLGLQAGDKIQTVGFTIPAGGGVFADPTDKLDLSGALDDITTTIDSPGGPETLIEAGGGAINLRLDLASESLVHDGFGFFSYSATFGGRAGASDVEFFSPTGGPAPEQDGRLLISGNFGANIVTLSVGFSIGNVILNLAPTMGIPLFSGTFGVTGGDATFRSAFGSTGDLADVVVLGTSSVPSTNTLMTDGWLFSVRNTNLAACALLNAGSACGGTVLNTGGNFTFGATGEIKPQNASPFVPEPSTGLLVGAGLLGLLATTRRLRS